MTCIEDPSTIFGAFAFPKLNSENEFINDPS